MVSLSHMRKTFDRSRVAEKLEEMKLERAEIALASARLAFKAKLRKEDERELIVAPKEERSTLWRFLFGSVLLFILTGSIR